MPEDGQKKPVIRTAVQEFAEDFFGKPLSNLKSNQLHEALLRFYPESCVNSW